ncbi:MAG: hypothetical protein MUC59_13960 [Saprospiraceae bacterium]|nr:hypothetical protein [Saprospiraceae bacterium]
MRRQTADLKKEVEHHCIGHKEGDWIIFTCPVCRDYQRQINCVTKQVTVRKGNSNAIHIGSHAPVVSSVEQFSRN